LKRIPAVVLTNYKKEEKMKLKYISMLFAGMCLFALLACSGNQGEARELFETAQFEELQKNNDHARQLYKDILKRYPKSEYAKKAEVKLAALGK